jgi:hypothetical protein
VDFVDQTNDKFVNPMKFIFIFNYATVGLNSVHREILSSVTIVFYDKVRGQNKAQR